MPIGPAPLWESWLFESPWPLMFLLLVAAIVLRVVSRRRRKAGLTYAALAALALVPVVWLVARAVVTDREAILERTRSLVSATAPVDAAAVNGLVAPGAVVAGPDGTPWLGYDLIRPELERVVQRFGVESQEVRAAAAEASGATGRSVIDLRTTLPSSGFGAPVATVWELHWRRGDDGAWRVTEVRWLEFMNREPERGMWR